MKSSIEDAQARLSDLVSRAEQREDVVLTREGRDVVRLSIVPHKRRLTGDERIAIMRQVQAMAKNALPTPSAARSQDFLYDENGLPT